MQACTAFVLIRFLLQRVHVKVKPKTPSSVPEIFVLIGVGELKCIIEVCFPFTINNDSVQTENRAGE